MSVLNDNRVFQILRYLEFYSNEKEIIMSNTVKVQVNQIGPSASQGKAREHAVVMDRPEAKGGENRGAMGGEHLLMALGGCFMSNLLAAGQSREIDLIDVHLEIAGNLESAPPRFAAIEMIVSADHADKTELEKLITIAERSCIVANTLKKSVEVSVSVAA